MFAVLIVFYFALVTAAAAWLLLPGVREWVRVRVVAGLAHLGGSLARWAGREGPHPASSPSLDGARAGASKARPWFVPATLLLVAAPAISLWLRQHHAYDGFDHTASREVNLQVAALLTGEQLVPPSPLPPELFLAPELQRERPLISTASRHWDQLDSEFRHRLLAVYRVMKVDHGIDMVLIEGLRSAERQAQLAALGPQVTHAGAGESYHQYGLAADSAFLFDGRIVISETDPRAAAAYQRYGEVAQSAGLVWGGSWRTLKDLGHVELRRAGVLRKAPPPPPGSDAPSTTGATG